MELIIKIPDEVYENRNFCHYFGAWGDKLEDLIENATPLPKGHGRLIEEPTEADISNTVGGNNDFAECIRDSVKAVFENATTIVEADKENNNETDN